MFVSMKAMDRMTKKKILYAILSAVVLLFWGSGIYYGQYIKDCYQSVSIRLDGEEAVTKRALMRALENEAVKNTKLIPLVTAWNCLNEQQVENEELAVKTKVRLLEVSGDMNQVYPMRMKRGAVTHEEDYKGCLIDETTAYELFKTTDSVGNLITYRDKEYCIRGIIKTKEQVVVIRIEDREHAYSNLELVYEDKLNGDLPAQDFMMQNGLAGSYMVLEGGFIAGILRLFYLLPAWFLGFYMLAGMIGQLWKRRNLPLQAVTLALLYLLAWVVVSWFMEFKIHIPERLIPTQWSDFSFWTEKFNALQHYMSDLDYLIPVPKDVLLVRYARRSLYYSLIALFGMIIFVRHRYLVIRKNHELRLCLLAILLEGASVLLLFMNGKLFHVTRSFLYMLPIFIISTGFKSSGMEWIRKARIKFSR